MSPVNVKARIDLTYSMNSTLPQLLAILFCGCTGTGVLKPEIR